jgi:hypothetical protein
VSCATPWSGQLLFSQEPEDTCSFPLLSAPLHWNFDPLVMRV